MCNNDNHQPLTLAQSALAIVMGMDFSLRPEWLSDFIAIQSALTTDEKKIDKGEHLLRSSNDRAEIRKSPSYKRKVAKSSTTAVARRITKWGVIEMRVLPRFEGEDGQYEGFAFHFRPKAVGEEPRLQSDLRHRGGYWAIDIVFTDWLRRYVLHRFSGPGELLVDEGQNFIDVAVVQIIGRCDQIDWHAACSALAAIFNKKFDVAAASVIRKVQDAHQAARR